MDAQKCFEILLRDAESIHSPEGLLQKLKSGKRLKIKMGADPSRPDLHLGHSVVLRKLKMLQDLGHEIIFVIGDFTGMIGDPSGKSKTRVPLTFDETRENGKSYFEQVTKILDREKTVITYNSEWLSKMNFADVLGLAGKYTLARVMERDDFANRYSKNQPIGLHELFYPLMQGYDSVQLKADIEVGGTDQTFNLLVGRELQKDFNLERQEVITFPLLPGLDGKEKMSKSLDNYIGIDEKPEDMFQKCMRVPDDILPDYFRLTTDLADCPEDKREAHFIYAREIVTMYCGSESAKLAEKRYLEVAAGKIPEIKDVLTLPRNPIPIVDLLCAAGLASSKGDARRLIQGGGIKLCAETVSDTALVPECSGEITLSRGKNRFIRVVFR